MTFDWGQVWTWLPLIASGFRVALLLSVIAVVLTMVVALPLALMRMSRHAALAIAANALIAITRSIPLYVFMLWFYYGLPLLLGISISPIVAGVIILVVQFTAFQAEAYRSGFLVVSKGQREAAAAVGLSRLQTFTSIVVPQAMQVAIPPTGNNLIAMVKATSVLSVIGIVEGTNVVTGIVQQTGRPLEFFSVLAVVYIAIVGVISLVLGAYEKTVRVPTKGPFGVRQRPGTVARSGPLKGV
jgi:polar amino acid transport system permease protein